MILSTIHSAKGQEWKAVFVLNLVDGCIPSDMAADGPEGVEEERRLLYVAMTRARDQLQLVQPERFHVTGQARHGDRYVRAPRSRFLPDGLLHLFDHVATGAGLDAPAPAAVALPRIDLGAVMKSMWE
jgi:DNA helicase II / ATP-dependent DNA helicase PcrA